MYIQNSFSYSQVVVTVTVVDNFLRRIYRSCYRKKQTVYSPHIEVEDANGTHDGPANVAGASMLLLLSQPQREDPVKVIGGVLFHKNSLVLNALMVCPNIRDSLKS